MRTVQPRCVVSMLRTFRLTNEPGGLGLSCTNDGLSLAGVPLLRKTDAGFQPRSASEITALLKAAYVVDPTRLQSSVGIIAQALNSGNLARAAIAAVLTATPELNRKSLVRLAKAQARLAKYDEDESRDWHGRWTDEGATAPNAPATTSSAEATDDDSRQAISLEEALERKYDDLGPVEFAKEVIQFGDWLGREGPNLSPDDRAQALAEYSFGQERLSFWLTYDYTPPNAQLNLHSAALTLYQGGVNGGLVGPGDLPPSMLDVGGAAWGADNAPPNLRPATAKPNIEFPRPVPEDAANDVEGLGGMFGNDEVGIVWNKGNEEQGNKWEDKVGEESPDATRLVKNSTGFDYFDPSTGEAINAKTLNTLTINRIKRPQAILSRLKGYVDDAEDYQPNRDSDLNPADIKSKTIQLAVPQYTSPTQWLYLNLGIRYAREHGVSLTVTRIRE